MVVLYVLKLVRCRGLVTFFLHEERTVIVVSMMVLRLLLCFFFNEAFDGSVGVAKGAVVCEEC